MFGDGNHVWGGPSGRIVVNIGARTDEPATLVFLSTKAMTEIALTPDGHYHHYTREVYLEHGEKHDLLVGEYRYKPEDNHLIAINAYYFSPVETPVLYEEP